MSLLWCFFFSLSAFLFPLPSPSTFLLYYYYQGPGASSFSALVIIAIIVAMTTNDQCGGIAQIAPLRGHSRIQTHVVIANLCIPSVNCLFRSFLSVSLALFSQGILRQTNATDKPKANIVGECPIAALGLGLRKGVPVTVEWKRQPPWRSAGAGAAATLPCRLEASPRWPHAILVTLSASASASGRNNSDFILHFL